ncbi:MAG: nuclear transport factor 2 family protein [Sphingomonadaceae bacterium]
MNDTARLDRLEARIAIADLVHEYARLVRRDLPEEVHKLFAPDGWFEIRDGHPDREEFTVRERLDSPQALHDYLAPGKGKPHPIPLIRNLMIKVEGDTGTANSVMDGPIQGSDQRVFGEYRDTFRKVDGTWRFASRIFTIFGSRNV